MGMERQEMSKLDTFKALSEPIHECATCMYSDSFYEYDLCLSCNHVADIEVCGNCSKISNNFSWEDIGNPCNSCDRNISPLIDNWKNPNTHK
jgi:hypothetical protein